MGMVVLFFVSVGACVGVTWILRRCALRWRVLDMPGSGTQKIHKTPTALLGGVAPLGVWCVVVWSAWAQGWAYVQDVSFLQLAGVTVGIALITAWGIADDVLDLSPRMQSLGATLAALAPVVGGVTIHVITNPFGGSIDFDTYAGIGAVIASGIVFLFVFASMHVTKVLDGLDGLVAGITAIGMAVIASIALSEQWYQPSIATLAVIGCGVWIGILFWNRHPARIFLGNAGSYGAGYMLACLAVLSSSKIATLLLVLAVPIMDLLVVMIRRVFVQKKSPFLADRTHIHHRLLSVGFSHIGVVWVLWGLSVIGGVCALLIPSPLRYVVLAVFLLASALGLVFLRVK